MTKSKIKLFLLDWDDNILVMPTKIVLDKLIKGKWTKVSISSLDFRKIKNKIGINYRLRSESFKEFKSEKKFNKDLTHSIKNKHFGPSLEKFIDALVNVNDFGIITARGHSPETLKSGVKLIIKNLLTKDQKKLMIKNLGNKNLNDYLNEQKYRTVSSKEFLNEFNLNEDNKIEIGKRISFIDYVENYVRNNNTKLKHTISIGYSDDDLSNIKTIEDLIKKELKQKFPNIKFVVYDTSNPNKIKKKTISGSY